MGEICPPYLNKNAEQKKVELQKAEAKEAKAKEAYEAAVEYTKLCRQAYEEAQK